jgi:hypothetical protein
MNETEIAATAIEEEYNPKHLVQNIILSTSTWCMHTENIKIYWIKQKQEQQNNSRITKEWLRKKEQMQNVIYLLVVMIIIQHNYTE